MQPTGEVHLGNYLGALQYWVSGQHTKDAFHGIVDLHALTVTETPGVIGQQTVSLAAWFFAIGLDPEVATVFVQSHVPEHTQLAWIMECTISYGELTRMVQFKDKSSKREHQFISAGLFTYPALQAADILLYDANEVPVGDDQRQHVEITRDAAIRFNHRFGDTFVVPEAVTPAAGARVMSLQDPTSKMSKSDESGAGCVYLVDEPAAIMKKFKRAVTDSETGPGSVRFDRAEKPGISSLLEINAAVTGRTPQAVAERPRAVRVAEGRDRRGRRRHAGADPGPLPRAHGGSWRTGPPAAGRGREGPHRRRGDARSRDECDRHVARLKLSPIDRRIVRLGIPALGTLAVEPLYRLVDTAIVGRIGTDELAGWPSP